METMQTINDKTLNVWTGVLQQGGGIEGVRVRALQDGRVGRAGHQHAQQQGDGRQAGAGRIVGEQGRQGQPPWWVFITKLKYWKTFFKLSQSSLIC